VDPVLLGECPVLQECHCNNGPFTSDAPPACLHILLWLGRLAVELRSIACFCFKHRVTSSPSASTNTATCIFYLCTCSEQPQILEYIKLKAQVGELQKEAADWQRKVEVVAGTASGRAGSSASGRLGSGKRLGLSSPLPTKAGLK
jgi:hypothetical protein